MLEYKGPLDKLKDRLKKATNATEIRFNGSDYIPGIDDKRFVGQMLRIFNLMKDEQWRTLDEISKATGDPAASISAQLRHLRKKRFGSHIVNRQSRGDREHGLYEYQLIVNKEGENA